MAAMQIRSIPQRRNAPLRRCWRRTALGLACILVTACSSLAPVANIQSPGLRALTPTFTPFQPLLATVQPEQASANVNSAPGTPQPSTALPAETAVPTSAAVSVWVDPRLPAALRQGLVLPAGIAAADHPEQASMRLEPGGANPVSHWIYALVAPFPEKTDSVTVDTLQSAWKGQSDGLFAGRPLLVDDSTLAIFAGLWGPPGAGTVHTLPASDLLNFAWEHRPAWAIVPFEAVEPRWKVLAVGGLSPLHKAFDPAAYALTVPISLVGQINARQLAAELSAFVPPTNRDPARLTVVALTGTTALVRATAYTMEQKGITYPGQDVRDILRSADLTHVSNEVPFAEDCPYPNPVQPDMRFCSDPRYIGLLEDVGTDIVELTGDHFQDWGVPAMRYTLDLYRELGWKYYGGGENLEDGRKPLLVEHNGNRLAFIGCNGKRGSFAQAAAEHPGAVPCDYDWLDQEVARLRAEGYLPIVTLQHFEYYTYRAQPDQEHDFRAAAEAGAVIVSGSQGHQPQGMEFRSGAFIHYGLGNLFFDQYDVSLACRQAFIDRHVFYAGRYLGVELLPILFIDYARPRPMTAAEQGELLDAVFSASGW